MLTPLINKPDNKSLSITLAEPNVPSDIEVENI
jgi:hypothetical protein